MQKFLATVFVAILISVSKSVFATRPCIDDPYIFGLEHSNSVRLDEHNQLLFLKSCEHLKCANLSRGQIVWDIGCGSGVMTVHLAQTVGISGHVYALDKSQKQINKAQNRVTEVGLKNVTFICADINKLRDFNVIEADLIYMRHLLMYVKQPNDILQTLKNLLRVGGVVVSHEPIINTAMSSINDEVVKEYFDTLVSLGKQLQVNYNIGINLKLIFQQAGYSYIKDFSNQPHITLAAAKLPLILGLEEWSDLAVMFGITTPEKINHWIAIINRWVDSDNSFYAIAKQMYVIAYK